MTNGYNVIDNLLEMVKVANCAILSHIECIKLVFGPKLENMWDLLLLFSLYYGG